MVGLYRRIPENPLLQQFGRSQLAFPLGATLDAVAGDPLVSPSGMIEGQRELEEARGLRGAFGQPDLAPDADERDLSPLVPADELNRRFGHLGLEFEAPEREEAALLLVEQKRAEIIRETVIAQGPGGVLPLAAQFGTAIAASALDPLNVAASFVPVIGQARYARWAARVGNLRARAATGAIEGTVGAALIEPFTFGLSQAQQLDYDMADALVNVSIGTVLGTGLQVGTGTLSDIAGRAATRRLEAQIETARAHEEALRTAVAQAVQGRAIDVEPVLRDSELVRDLMGGASVRALEAGRETPIATLDLGAPARAAEAGEVAPAALSVPSVTRRGGLRAFDSEAEALDAARRMSGDPARVERLPDGRFAIVRERPGADVERRPDGSVRRFPNRRQAQRFIDRMDEGAPEPRALPTGEGDFVVARGLSAADAAAVEANPRVASFPDRPRETFTPAQPRPVRPLEQDLSALSLPRTRPSRGEVRRRLAAEGAPERDATADFRASEEISREAEEIARTDVAETAQNEADFAAELVEDLRRQGRLDEREGAEIQEVERLLERATAYGRAAREAAVCMTRP